MYASMQQAIAEHGLCTTTRPSLVHTLTYFIWNSLMCDSKSSAASRRKLNIRVANTMSIIKCVLNHRSVRVAKTTVDSWVMGQQHAKSITDQLLHIQRMALSAALMNSIITTDVLVQIACVALVQYGFLGVDETTRASRFNWMTQNFGSTIAHDAKQCNARFAMSIDPLHTSEYYVSYAIQLCDLDLRRFRLRLPPTTADIEVLSRAKTELLHIFNDLPPVFQKLGVDMQRKLIKDILALEHCVNVSS